MASMSVERIMDRVMLVIDCATTEEADNLFEVLKSQALDGAFHLRWRYADELPLVVDGGQARQ